jgi:hypothetical protein
MASGGNSGGKIKSLRLRRRFSYPLTSVPPRPILKALALRIDGPPLSLADARSRLSASIGLIAFLLRSDGDGPQAKMPTEHFQRRSQRPDGVDPRPRTQPNDKHWTCSAHHQKVSLL